MSIQLEYHDVQNEVITQIIGKAKNKAFKFKYCN
jgi:hypothetical protein